jgi:S-adenosylmethionine:tRNA ribosyltransferase-isomerase
VFTSDFDYELPQERIAQRPASPRDSSKLLVLDRTSGEIRHYIFREITEFLGQNDVLVLNETKVIPARIHGWKTDTGGKIEILLIRRLSSSEWECIVGGTGLRPGVKLAFPGDLQGEVLTDLGDTRRVVKFSHPISPRLYEIGEMPLPPYIHEPLRDKEEYQTVFALHPGSVAAPTAGLHFTPELLLELNKAGVTLLYITLHIGLDTFLPIRSDDPSDHAIHSEWYQVSASVANGINTARENGKRIVGVGTTTVRALESASSGGRVVHKGGFTNLYILPGYRFKTVDAMITNFHLPRSSLLMMVSAFAGRDLILDTYKTAVEKDYRFYSFGDAMLIE